MDAFDLFKKLSAGTKFDKKRFRSDVEKFKVRYCSYNLIFNIYYLFLYLFMNVVNCLIIECLESGKK